MQCNATRHGEDLGVPDFCRVASHRIALHHAPSSKYDRVNLKWLYLILVSACGVG